MNKSETSTNNTNNTNSLVVKKIKYFLYLVLIICIIFIFYKLFIFFYEDNNFVIESLPILTDELLEVKPNILLPGTITLSFKIA